MAKEDEAGVAFHIKGDAVEFEALRDGGLHLADRARGGRVQVDEGAVFAVHYEVTVGAPAFGDFDEVVDAEAAGPC